MLLVILFAIILVVGIVFVVVSDSWMDWAEILGLFCTIIGVGGLLSSLIIITIIQSNADVNYQANLERREMLIYRLEHQDDNLVGNELLYQEIRAFNENLREHKKWANNPWVNWFYNEKNATFEYIDYKDIQDLE